MKLDVVTPEGSKITDMDTVEITLPGIVGEMGILPGHVAMMAGLGAGPMLVQTDKGPQLFAISGGFVEVLNEQVRVLTETCEGFADIDADRAREKLVGANTNLDGFSPADGEAYQVALSSVKKHETRIKVAEDGKSLGG